MSPVEVSRVSRCPCLADFTWPELGCRSARRLRLEVRGLAKGSASRQVTALSASVEALSAAWT